MPLPSQPMASPSNCERSTLVIHDSLDGVDYVLGADMSDSEDLAEPSGTEIAMPSYSYDRFPLRKYIRECGLPLYRYQGIAVTEEMDIRKSFRWPNIVSLGWPDDPYQLWKVRRYADYAHVRNEIYSFFRRYDEDVITRFPPYPFEFALPFHLPHEGTVHFEESDCHALNDIQNETERVLFLNKFIFDTVLAVICMINNWNPLDPLDQPKVEKFRFRIANRLCFDKYAKWDIFILPDENNPNRVPLVFVFIPPKYFGIADFNELVRERELNIPRKEKPKEPADVIWALLYKVLKGRGRRFVVSNYVRWAFGQFDEAHEVGYITHVYHATITNEAGDLITMPAAQYCSPMELLVRWMTDIPEKDGIYPNRFIDPREVDEAFRQIMQGHVLR